MNSKILRTNNHSMIIQIENVLDDYVREWIPDKEIFYRDQEYIYFIKFIEQKYGVGFNQELWIWESTVKNDIIQMQEKLIKEINRYIDSYNNFVAKKETLMPKLTKKCELLYAQQRIENKNLKLKLEQQNINFEQQTTNLKSELKNLKDILVKHGIKVE
ncbi:hypothetical protein [Spiroplasma culicicola]|uniref:Uncharacterized protein n=1 Tax=Spiroplasma culicicola AES-1 TaxID=1276246 RepID=W6A7V9_9MOLU|nr:hypothetical protein [Spiroplasma culicicola]AHI52970.1 hypothetical protein SCULI_v1c06290 [Spiroplasma culicicola AES-1]